MVRRVRQERLADVLERRELHEHREDALGQGVGQPLVDAERELGRVGGPREGVEHLAGALHARVGQVERLALEPGLVGDVVQRVGHEVDRHDVRAPSSGPTSGNHSGSAARAFWIALKK